MKKLNSVFAFILFFSLGSLAFSCSASAYLDPSAVTFIVQAVAGIAIASVAAVGFYFKKLQRKLKKKDEYSPIDTLQSMNLDLDLAEFDDSEFDTTPSDMPVNPDYQTPVKADEQQQSADIVKQVVYSEDMSAKEKLKTKLNTMWKDERSYKQRLLIAIAPIILLFFTFFFFSPFEMALTNSNSLAFKPVTVGITMIIAAILISAVSIFVLPLLRGKIFNNAISATFAVGLASYIQGNILNGNLGALTGDAIAWHNMKLSMLINIIVWAVIFVIPFILAFFSKSIWNKSLRFISIILCAAQIVGIVSLFITPKSADPSYLIEESEYYFSEDGLHTFSTDHNVVVFLLDRLDYDCIAEVLKENPEFFDELDGFTSYTNAISEFARTLPGASHILTGYEDNVYLENSEDYLDKSWASNNILTQIKDADYDIDIFSTTGTMFGTPSKFTDVVSNISSDSLDINYSKLFSNMSMISAYKHSPTLFKPFFWCYSDDVSSGIYVKDTRYEIDEIRFSQDIDNITFDENGKSFKFYHFNGPHAPYILNADGTKNPLGTSRKEQTMGSFRILYNTFEKMKEMGIYKDSEIFIVADHGEAVSDRKPLTKATAIGLFHKPSGCADTPLVQSSAPVSHKNIPATILKAIGVNNYTDYGTPLDEVAEDANITRYFYKSVLGEKNEEKVYKYEITGNALDFKNWTVIEEYDVVDFFY